MRVKLDNLSLESQQGVTLLLSILVLSSITAVAFSLAAVTFIEVRTSGDVIRTEPIFYSDQGIAEEAVYGLKRGASPASATPPTSLYFGTENSTGCSPGYVSYTAPDSSIQSSTKICNISSQGNIEVLIPSSASSYTTAKRFYLFNPANAGTGPGGYSRIKITNTSKFALPVQVYICRLDQECSSPGTYPWTANGDLIAQNSFRDYVSPSIDGSAYSYEVSIINRSTVDLPNIAKDLFVKIETFDTGGVALKGLPYLNKRAVQIQSTKSGLTRRVEVLVPTQ